MVKFILFLDVLRQEEIERFYKNWTKLKWDHTGSNSFQIKKESSKSVHPVESSEACQMHRDYYRGYPKAHHPLSYFREGEYTYQCPAEMSDVYLSYPAYHTRYKQPAVLATTTAATSGFPTLPDRSLAARFNKQACKAYSR